MLCEAVLVTVSSVLKNTRTRKRREKKIRVRFLAILRFEENRVWSDEPRKREETGHTVFSWFSWFIANGRNNVAKENKKTLIPQFSGPNSSGEKGSRERSRRNEAMMQLRG